MRKPKVGEKLFLVSLDSRKRNNRECTVSRVGRKYFYITTESIQEEAFCISDWEEKIDYGEADAVFESEKEWKNSTKATKIAKTIGKELQYTTHPTYRNRFELDKLISVAKILGIEI